MSNFGEKRPAEAAYKTLNYLVCTEKNKLSNLLILSHFVFKSICF